MFFLTTVVLVFFWLPWSCVMFEVFIFCLFSMHLIIRKQQPWYSTPSCLLPSLLLRPCCAFETCAPIPMQIYLQTYLKVLVKSITHLPYRCWNINCNKLCSNTFLSSYLSYSIYYSLLLFFSIICPPSPFAFLLEFPLQVFYPWFFSLGYLDFHIMRSCVCGNHTTLQLELKTTQV